MMKPNDMRDDKIDNDTDNDSDNGRKIDDVRKIKVTGFIREIAATTIANCKREGRNGFCERVETNRERERGLTRDAGLLGAKWEG